ncbi:hypothetical protein DPMN_033299 [Dreissena polymorpha]|uniref:Uncharacterized protein n=1 Tax=Dreissena polymorpha TaxID=45954 RepID=A0A9D4M6R6_DREPO|nr:hypothetical protein DPMN_033299 [Dreissena polymorpha]
MMYMPVYLHIQPLYDSNILSVYRLTCSRMMKKMKPAINEVRRLLASNGQSINRIVASINRKLDLLIDYWGFESQPINHLKVWLVVIISCRYSGYYTGFSTRQPGKIPFPGSMRLVG